MESSKDRIRRLREQKRSRNRLDLLVPGYEGELAVRYKPIPEARFKVFSKRLQESQESGSTLDAAKEFIAESQECVLIREGGDLVPLRDEGGMVGFDQRLAEYLEIEVESVKDVITEVFSPDGTAPAAPVAHADALSEWMRGNDSEIDKALLGE